ncbi:MAG: hypothetical protein ABI912_05410 [Actinomycetota bacterium]
MADMTRAREELDDLAGEFAAAGAMKGMIFGHHGLKTAARKMFCFEHGDSLVFKLDDEAHNEAIGLAGAAVFTPMADRPMNGWIVVPERHSAQWSHLAQAAFAYVTKIEATAPKKRTGR